MSENLLKHETSPYLLQHADNPVHWRAWGREAFDEARSTGKPVLLSVGYAACHWCHVMAHECFEDPTVADVMNELFVNIKVDREERPDVDQLYMSSLHLLGEQGGWPLTMFLTPDGEPVWGGTYFPKEPKYGRPGFVQVMREFDRIYREEPGKVEHNRAAIAQRLSAPPLAGDGDLFPDLPGAAGRQILSLIDPDNGGLRGAPKFPQGPLLDLLWRAGTRAGDARMHDGVLHSLRRMARGGICDHLGGGFSRYTVDERWLVPHFEKMLYDNAQLIELLTRAWLATGDALFRSRIEETVAWIQREMLAEGGAFASSLDADSEGEEGRYYIWTAEEIDAALGPDAALFREAYDITEAGNFEGRNIPNRLSGPFSRSPEDEARLAASRATLLTVRSGRVPPQRDDKILADWNGLMIAALTRAAMALRRPDWREMAARAYRFVADSMSRDGRLAHSHRNGRQIFPGLAGDHAAMALAALSLHEATGAAEYLNEATTFLEALHAWHADAESGGYLMAPSDADDLVHRLRGGHDDAIPNHNALAASALVRLYHLTGDTTHLTRADAVFASFTGPILANALAHASLVSAFDLRLSPIQIVIIGDAGSDDCLALRHAAFAIADPNAIVQSLAPDQALPKGHPASGKARVENRATAYVCVGETCSLPITDARQVADAARRPAAPG